MVDDIAAPARIAGKDALGVGMAAEGPAGGKLLAQLDMVIDLDVKGDGRAVGPFHGLAGSFDAIDDRQAEMGKSGLTLRRLTPDRKLYVEGTSVYVRCGFGG